MSCRIIWRVLLGWWTAEIGCFGEHFCLLLQAIYIRPMTWYWWWHWQSVWCDFCSSFTLQLLCRMERVLNLSETQNCTHLVWHAVTGAEVMMHLVTSEDWITLSDQKVSTKCKESCVRCGVLCWQDTVFVLASSNFDRVAMRSTAMISENITEIFKWLGIN